MLAEMGLVKGTHARGMGKRNLGLSRRGSCQDERAGWEERLGRPQRVKFLDSENAGAFRRRDSPKENI